MADLAIPRLRHQRFDARHPNAGAHFQSFLALERPDPGTLSERSAGYTAPRSVAKKPGNDTDAASAPAISLSSPS